MGETSPAREPDASWPARCVEESRAYLLRVCGASVPGAVLERALADVVDVAGAGPSPQTLGPVRARIRDAALREAARSTGRTHRRLPAPPERRAECAEVPGLLGQRATGEIGADAREELDQRLERCPACRALDRRFEAAERELQDGLVPGPSEPAGGRPTSSAANIRAAQPPIETPPEPAPSAPRTRRLPGWSGKTAAAGLVLALVGAGVVLAGPALDSGRDAPSIINPIIRRPLGTIPILTGRAGGALPGGAGAGARPGGPGTGTLTGGPRTAAPPGGPGFRAPRGATATRALRGVPADRLVLGSVPPPPEPPARVATHGPPAVGRAVLLGG